MALSWNNLAGTLASILMILVFCLLIGLSALLFPVISLDTVYIIRHCDKVNDSDPCCSREGYIRANTWNTVLDVMFGSNKMNIFSTKADYGTSLCLPHVSYTADATCQSSQRMSVTSSLIYYNTKNSKAQLNLNYCSKDYVQVVQDIYDGSVNKALIVWSHDEIVEILNEYNVDISAWPDDIVTDYSIIFELQFTGDSDKNPSMSYNCYDYKNNVMSCQSGVHQWLKDYPLFNVTLPQ